MAAFVLGALAIAFLLKSRSRPTEQEALAEADKADDATVEPTRGSTNQVAAQSTANTQTNDNPPVITPVPQPAPPPPSPIEPAPTNQNAQGDQHADIAQQMQTTTTTEVPTEAVPDAPAATKYQTTTVTAHPKPQGHKDYEDVGYSRDEL